MKIIGISGKKQSGKTTVVRNLIEQCEQAWLINFAEPLKEIVIMLFVPDEWDWGVEDLDKNKDKILPCGLTVRDALQWFGTDVCRKRWPDVWLNCYRRNLVHRDIDELVITSDVRFPNEVFCIQQLGGHVIRLLRAPFPDDKHESETALDLIEKRTIDDPAWVMSDCNIHFDAFIDNREMTIDEQNEAVWRLVNERGWI